MMSTPLVPAESQQTMTPCAAPATQQANELRTRLQKYRFTIKRLAIAEVNLGILCIVLAILIVLVATTSYSPCYPNLQSTSDLPCYPHLRFTAPFVLGEGIGCGVFIIITGSLGLHAAAKIYVSQSLMMALLILSIISSVLCEMLVILAVLSAIQSEGAGAIAVCMIMCVCALSSMILLILSASYCCATMGCSCTKTNYEIIPPNQNEGHVNPCSSPQENVEWNRMVGAGQATAPIPNDASCQYPYHAQNVVQPSAPVCAAVPSPAMSNIQSPVMQNAQVLNPVAPVVAYPVY